MSKNLKSRCLWLVVNVSRLILACTFLFSGTVKLIDPHGTEYKIEDYGQAFGLMWLMPYMTPLFLAVLLAMVEFLLGIYILFGFRRKLTTRCMLAFMLVMTPLTLYLALENPVTDCGCFGDAWVLTNWQTFWKNVVLLAAAVATVCCYKRMTSLIMERNAWIVSLYSWVFAVVFASINLYGLPLIDFRPYHIGADIMQEMGARDDDAQYETYFILEKDGERREFSLEDYPDSTWTFIDSRTELVKGSEQNSLGEMLSIQSVETGADQTLSILQDPSYKFLLIAPYLEKADDGVMDRLMALSTYCEEYGYPFYCLTASGGEAINEWIETTGAEYAFFHADAVVLKTIVRSNPGLVLLHGSTVMNKWPSTSLPGEKELTAPLEQLEMAFPEPKSMTSRTVRIFLWYVLPLLFVVMADRLWFLWRYKRNSH